MLLHHADIFVCYTRWHRLHFTLSETNIWRYSLSLMQLLALAHDQAFLKTSKVFWKSERHTSVIIWCSKWKKNKQNLKIHMFKSTYGTWCTTEVKWGKGAPRWTSSSKECHEWFITDWYDRIGAALYVCTQLNLFSFQNLTLFFLTQQN